MEKNTRKSSALISLVLVPLNLMGLGFTGCDSRDDSGNAPNTATADEAGSGDGTPGEDDFAGDFEDPNDPFNLDPVPSPVAGPVAHPATQPLANSPFATLPPQHSNVHSAHYGSGVHFFPIPYRVGYRPAYRSSTGYRSSTPSISRSSSSSSSTSHSSGASRGGFGSHGASVGS